MHMRHVLTVVALGCVLTIGPLAFAGSQHVAEAIMHAQAAVLQGQQGYPDELVTHAQEALKHAEMAREETISPHLEEGIKDLQEAIIEAKNGYVNEAVEEAEEAIRHLSAIR